MKKTTIIAMISLPLITAACTGSADENQELTETVDNSNGKELMENNCFSCHNTQGTDNMLAPPMQRVKDHYLDENTTKDEFVTSIVEWCKNPTEENSRMPGARNKFGLMPKQEFDWDEVAAIASYLYENDLEQSCSHH